MLVISAVSFTPLEVSGSATTGVPTVSARLDLVLAHDFADPVVTSLIDGIDVRTNRDLLIQQWRETRLDDVMRERLAEVQTKVVEVLRYLEDAGSVETAQGVWLDYIGERLGIPRPFIPATGITWFGFDDAGATFGGASLRSDLAGLTVLAPLGDACYRDLMRARVVLLNPDTHANGSKPLMEAALVAGGIIGTVHDNQDGTADVVLTDLPMATVMLPLWREVLKGPAGIDFTVTIT